MNALPDDLPGRFARELDRPALAGWRRAWSPELSYGRHACRPRASARRAAVAIVFCRAAEGWALPLTVRSQWLQRHGGQISFPGGLIEPGETPQAAAARELHEELGAEGVCWLGELPVLWVFASNAAVTPCVGWIPAWPDWQPNPAEVARVLRLPLAALLDPRTPERLRVERGSWRFAAPCLRVDDEPVWGATAVVLGELQGRLRRLLGGPASGPETAASLADVAPLGDRPPAG